MEKEMTSELSRREFIKKAGVASAGFALSSCPHLTARAASPGKKPKRPNILFVIADDWSWPHAGVYGDKVVNTPSFNRVASEGILFANSFCAAPTCTASRAAILTGQAPHRLEEGANLHSALSSKFPVYADILEESGYIVGFTGKGWGPGILEPGGRKRNPAGQAFKSFSDFLDKVPNDRPFCFWCGSKEPHRPYGPNSGVKAGLRLEDVKVPPFLPDTPEVRSDVLDYYYEVQLFDKQVGDLLNELDGRGLAENTLVVVTSDNGMPFPRAKANLYEMGTHMPLAIRWPARIKPGRVVDAFVSHCDFAPTFLEVAGLHPLPEMTGQSLLNILLGDKGDNREIVFTERERHANVRKGDLSYPCRAVRTRDYLYIRNFFPDRWPAGDPEMYMAVGEFGDIDESPTKNVVLNGKTDPKLIRFYKLACEKRPAEELYDIRKDPYNLSNLANNPKYLQTLIELRQALDKWMSDTGDPRAKNPHDDRWDKYPYYGNPRK